MGVGMVYAAKDVQSGVTSEALWTIADGDSLAATQIKHLKDRAAAGKSADSDQGDLPSYSSDPLYVSKKAIPTPKGGQPTSGGLSVRYEAGYGEYKKSSTGSGKPDLNASGKMLGSLAHKSDKNGVSVGVDSAYAAQVKGLESRGFTFMGLNDSDIKATNATLQSILDRKDLIPTDDMVSKDGKTRVKSSKKSDAPTKRTVT